MPFSFAFIFRALVMALLAAHVFCMYCMARAMSETVGFRPGTSAVACLFALAMLIPLVWAVAIPEIPEAFSQHILPRRRWRRGRCPHCAYDMRGMTTSPSESAAACPECGNNFREPDAADMWQVGSRTIARFIYLNLLAWIVGCTAGESWMLLDEQRFEQEIAMRGGTSGGDYGRARQWPNQSASLQYAAGTGRIHATD